MARLPRIEFANIPQHVVQRGNDRQPCFLDDLDYRRYLRGLQEATLDCQCRIHAYVLMTNHVHLLVTPASVGGVSRMMQQVGRGYVGYFNTAHHRTGTLWEGRFKSSLVDSDRYLLTCYRYIEMNPVRAAMVAAPGEYRWSSYASNAHAHSDPIVTPHCAVAGKDIAIPNSAAQARIPNFMGILRQIKSDVGITLTVPLVSRTCACFASAAT